MAISSLGYLANDYHKADIIHSDFLTADHISVLLTKLII